MVGYTDEAGVYCNKLGIMDADRLREVEYSLTATRSREILQGDALGKIRDFGLLTQQAIHKHLFQDVYEWAGKIRTVPARKRMANGMLSVFADPEDIEADWRKLEQKTHSFVTAKDWLFKTRRGMLVEICIDANRIHPFPEGNGRSLQVFMQLMAREQGVELNYQATNAAEWNRASAESGKHGRLFEHMYLIEQPPNPEAMERIFMKIALPAPERARGGRGEGRAGRAPESEAERER
jgi:cell filamentation protein